MRLDSGTTMEMEESKAFFLRRTHDGADKIAVRMRSIINKEMEICGPRSLVGTVAADVAAIRGGNEYRPIVIQTVDGNARVAEDYFLNQHPRRPPWTKPSSILFGTDTSLSIGARIARSGSGHNYWLLFSAKN